MNWGLRETSEVWLSLVLTLEESYSGFLEKARKKGGAGMNSRAKTNKSRRDFLR
jgi:hypothetical protein